MARNKKNVLWLVMFSIFFGNCSTAIPPPDSSSAFPITTFEKTIRAGMTRQEVTQELGAPKVIQNSTRAAEQDKEIWLFDVSIKEVLPQEDHQAEGLTLKFFSDPELPGLDSKKGTVEVIFDGQGKAQSVVFNNKQF